MTRTQRAALFTQHLVQFMSRVLIYAYIYLSIYTHEESLRVIAWNDSFVAHRVTKGVGRNWRDFREDTRHMKQATHFVTRSYGVTYKDLDSDWKLDLLAWLITRTNCIKSSTVITV
jgi:hypothetical protein